MAKKKVKTAKSPRWKAPKAKRGAWFVAVRGSYLPCSWQGWCIWALFGAYLVLAAFVGWHGNTVNKVVFFVLPNWIAAAVAVTWVAKQTS